jgi:hypothetical protein
MGQNAAGERLALRGEAVPPGAAGHEVRAVPPCTDVDVTAVADAGRVDLRGERRPEPVA